MFRRLAPLLCILAFALLLAACGDDDESGSSDSGSNAPAETETKAETTAEEPAEEGGCQEVDQPEPKPDGGAKPPKGKLDPGKTYQVVLETNCGDITIRLDQKVSPKTTASFANLAETGFYDDTFFHRIVPGFVIQGGDPTGTGTGGPGYTTRDAPPSGAQYPKYTVAMAKGAQEPSGTSGSQFFVMTGDSGLPPQYAIVGTVTKGMKVVDAIGELGDPAEQPTQLVLVEKTTVKGP